MKRWINTLRVTLLTIMVLVTSQFSAHAIITVSGDGPDSNTNVPPALMAMVGHFGRVLVTLINSNTVAIAAHTLGESDRVVYRGVEYLVTGSTNVALDVALLFVEGSFPTDASFAKLYEGTNYTGMEVTVVGKGGPKGDPIYREIVTNVVVTNIMVTTPNSTVLQNFAHSEDTDQFEVIGDAGLSFVVERTSDFGVWKPVLTNTIPETGITVLTIPAEATIEVEQPKNSFYRVMSLSKSIETVVTNTVTNSVTVGWLSTAADNITRSAKTILLGKNGEEMVMFRFEGPEGVSFSSGDSGGPMFNTAGELVGVGYGSAIGPYSWDQVDWFYGHITDRSGIHVGGYDQLTEKWVSFWKYPEGSTGIEVLYSILPAEVIKGIIGG